MYKVVFVVVTYNSEQYIRRCIESILSIGTSLNYSVIVVDNASSDGTCSKVKLFPKVTLIELDENVGFGRANNIGCSEFAADYYFIFNADAYFEGTFDLGAMVLACEHDDRVAISSARLQYPDGSMQTSSFTFSSPKKWLMQCVPGFSSVKTLLEKSGFVMLFLGFFSSKVRSYLNGRASVTPDYTYELVEWVSGAAMLVSSSYISEFGLFDEGIFLYGEDEDLCISAHLNGYKVVLQNTHLVTHVHGWNSSNKFNSVVAGYKMKSLTYFINKHFDKSLSGFIMRLILPVYVLGWKRVLGVRG